MRVIFGCSSTFCSFYFVAFRTAFSTRLCSFLSTYSRPFQSSIVLDARPCERTYKWLQLLLANAWLVVILHLSLSSPHNELLLLHITTRSCYCVQLKFNNWNSLCGRSLTLIKFHCLALRPRLQSFSHSGSQVALPMAHSSALWERIRWKISAECRMPTFSLYLPYFENGWARIDAWQ